MRPSPATTRLAGAGARKGEGRRREGRAKATGPTTGFLPSSSCSVVSYCAMLPLLPLRLMLLVLLALLLARLAWLQTKCSTYRDGDKEK